MKHSKCIDFLIFYCIVWNLQFNLEKSFIRKHYNKEESQNLVREDTLLNHFAFQLFYHKDSYSEPLGLENGRISSEAITSSSELDDKHSASRARLNSKPEGELMGAWVPLESDENQWLQVDLGKVLEVTKVSTQGGGDGVSTYVTSFILLCSEDGETFQDYQENDAVKVRNICM